jgi:uncharacterized protein YbjQ (UPF0145 family)
MGISTGPGVTAKITARLRSLGLVDEGETPCLVYDGTVLGSLELGLLVTDRRTIVFDDGSVQSIRHADAVSVDISPTSAPSTHDELTIVAHDGSTLERGLPRDARKLVVAELRGRVPCGVRVHDSPRAGSADLARTIERGTDRVVLTTTEQLEGRRIREYRGVVLAEAVVGATAPSGDLTGGDGHAILFADARKIAIARIVRAAAALGANAVVGVAVDYATTAAAQTLVYVRGTVVADEEPAPPGPFR